MSAGQGERIRQEWRQNARLRWGVLIVVLILGAQAVLAVVDARSALAKQYARDAELFARLRATAAERDWPRRARQAEKARLDMFAAIPEARSEGAARADLQARLDQLARDAVLTGATVRVETVIDVPGYPELRQAVGRLEGTVPTALDVAPFARAVAAGLPWMHAEQFEVGEGQPLRIVAILRSYYRRPGVIPAAPPASAGKKSGNARAAATARKPATAARPGQDAVK